ncbi:hypothetical protein ACJ41O_014894 [Fusarium nematophilum]
MHLFKHLSLAAVALPAALANPLCSTQARGTCTLTLWGRHVVDNNGFPPVTEWSEAVISDNNCQDIGGQTIRQSVWDQPRFAIFSTLWYTVDMQIFQQDDDYSHYKFCYAGKCYEGGAQCELRDDGNKYCQTAFVCDR